MTPRRPGWWMAYIGAPYLHRGRSLATGIDCWGLHRLVLAEEFDRQVDDFGWAYAEGDEKAGVAAARLRIDAELPQWRRIDHWEEGAGALFRVRGQPVHIATCTATPGVVLHAHGATGVTTLNFRKSLKWEGRFEACFLPPEP